MERFDYLFASLAFYIVKALHPKAEVTVKDFLPKFGPDADEPTEVDQQALRTKAGLIFARLGGIVKGGNARKPPSAPDGRAKRVYRRSERGEG